MHWIASSFSPTSKGGAVTPPYTCWSNVGVNEKENQCRALKHCNKNLKNIGSKGKVSKKYDGDMKSSQTFYPSINEYLNQVYVTHQDATTKALYSINHSPSLEIECNVFIDSKAPYRRKISEIILRPSTGSNCK